MRLSCRQSGGGESASRASTIADQCMLENLDNDSACGINSKESLKLNAQGYELPSAIGETLDATSF